ncbi:MAG TPA: hypothetical protein VM326_00690 [Sphingomicrobium sp.]|nr:hypothetical protein [Sphingomicrobium sp.]
MRRTDPKILAAIALGLLVLIIGIVMMSRTRTADQDKLSDAQAAGAGNSAAETRCASQATYDRIKLELFRRAAQVRTSDQAVFDRLAAIASVRMERPLLRSQDAELGTVRCTGRLSLDLPPGLAVVGGRRTLSADIDYVLQPAADGSGDVVMLEGADPIIVPLATLARTGETPPAPEAPAVPADEVPDAPPPPPSAAPEPPPPAPPQAREPDPAPPPPASAGAARPSFNCRYARTRGEIAVCRDEGLAALDRQMASQYYRALRVANARQRATLTATRDSFLRFRDRCPSDACIAETYRGRMREIRDIMSGDWRPER